jgi:orotidine-5'-phosphate decarboxylase
MHKLKSPFLFVALDSVHPNNNLDFAQRLAESCPEEGYGFKINLDHLLNFSEVAKSPYEAIREMQALNRPIFVDLKMWNGGRTMSAIAQGCASLGVALINLYPHAGGKFIQQVVKKLEGSETKLLGLTVLTHYTDEDTQKLYGRNLIDTVKFLSKINTDNGAHGIIAPPNVLQHLKDFKCLKLSPGIRPDWHTEKDNFQEQTATPSEAIKNGADFIVVGSAIAKAQEPATALKKVLVEISGK